LEETEHKSVAFDLFREVTKDWSALFRYKVRVHAMAASLPLILWNWTAIALLLMEADGVRRWTARWRIYRKMLGRRGLLRRSLGGLLHWFMPGFHPWNRDNRASMVEQRSKIDRQYGAAA
jgi:predicted metal-dependent hydrolase